MAHQSTQISVQWIATRNIKQSTANSWMAGDVCRDFLFTIRRISQWNGMTHRRINKRRKTHFENSDEERAKVIIFVFGGKRWKRRRCDQNKKEKISPNLNQLNRLVERNAALSTIDFVFISTILLFEFQMTAFHCFFRRFYYSYSELCVAILSQ